MVLIPRPASGPPAGAPPAGAVVLGGLLHCLLWQKGALRNGPWVGCSMCHNAWITNFISYFNSGGGEWYHYPTLLGRPSAGAAPAGAVVFGSGGEWQRW